MKSHTSNVLTALILFVGALLCAAPANAASITLTGTVGGSVGSPVVLLQWRATPSGSSYQVFRDGRLFATLGAVSQYTDAKVSAGQTHAYTLAGWGRPLLFPVYSNTVTVPLPAPRPSAPAAPTGLAATGVWGGTSGLPAGPAINLTWQPTAGAASYSVYRNGAPLQSGLTRTQGADLTAAGGQTYAYAVTAVGPGGESAKSAAVSATAPNPPAPAAPTGLTAHAFWEPDCAECSHMAMPEIDLAWAATSGATGYKVYRNGTLLQAGLTGPAFEDMTTASGQTYAYAVTAVGPGGESAKSAAVSATAPNPPTPTSGGLTPPTNVAIQGLWQGGPSDFLTWDAAPGAVGYNVYQYDVLIARNVSGTSFLVLSGLFNGAMTYTVTAIDAMGMESIPSAPSSAAGAVNPSQAPGWVPNAPAAPTQVKATSEWNAGRPRVHITWAGCDQDYTYSVYRDGSRIASGLWGLNYFDNRVSSGETHTYSVTGVNVPWTAPVESARSAALTVTALASAPMALASAPMAPASAPMAPASAKVQITGVQADDDSVQVFFSAVPGAVDYRVYDPAKPGTVKYAGRNEPVQSADMAKNGFAPFPAATTLSIEMNNIDPAAGANLVVEAVDKLGPFQKMDGMAGPGAMTMSGAMSSAINGQGDPSNVPNVIAASDPFQVTCRPRTLSGGQAFFDTFRNSTPFNPVAPDPAVAAAGNSFFEIGEVENANWRIRTYGADMDMTRSFIMSSHFMDTLYDGPTARTGPFSHNNNASLVMIPKATADISGGRVLHVTFEVDAHFDSRRWCDLLIGEAGDLLLHAAPQKLDGALPTVKGNLFAWEIQAGTPTIELIQPEAPGSTRNKITDLVQAASSNDQMTIDRGVYSQVFGVTKSYANGSALNLDKRSRFDLYLSQSRYRVVETQPDGVTQIVREHAFPAGVTLPFSRVQVYFTHELYHTGNDRPEIVNGAPEEAYWYNDRPWSDERHWDNMGQEVLNAFPALSSVAQ